MPWMFIGIVGFAMLVAILSLPSAVVLGMYVDARPDGQTPMTASSVNRLWTVGFSSLSFVFGLVGGKGI